MKIFSGSSNKPLAQKIAGKLRLKLSPLEIHVFPDGERRVRVLDRVVEENCVVVQPTSPNPDRDYMELFFIVDALKRSGAKSVTAVIPYLGYQRQDHVFRNGESVSLEVIATLLKWGGVDRIIAFDLHSIRIPEVFKIKLTHLSALSLFAQEIKKLGDDTVLISPDTGGIRRVKILSAILNDLSYAVIEKDRDLATGKVTMQGIKGTLGKNAVIVDDMISTGGTIVGAGKLLKSKGVKNIYVFVTHGVFSHDAPKILSSAILKRVYVTDTINITPSKKFPKLRILSVAGMIAEQLKSV